jgi:amino acid transporter
MALSLARLAKLVPEEGSFYAYAKQWGGHTVGLIASGSYLIGLIIAMGLLCQMAGLYLHALVPSMATETLGTITLLSLVGLNMIGVVLSEIGQHILIVCTVFPIVATIIICLMNGSVENLTPFAPFGMSNVIRATRIVIFGFFGFESAASLFNVVANPERNVPRALTYSIIIVGILYTLFIGSLIFATPMAYFATGMQLPDILSMRFPGQTWFVMAIRLSVLSAILGTIHSMIWGSSMLLVALADKAFSRTKLNPKLSVVIVGAGIFSTYALLKNMNLFFMLTAAFIIIAFLLSMISLLFIKEEWKSGQNIKTVIGMATALAILYFALEGLVEELTSAI